MQAGAIMKHSSKCPKCSKRKIERMNFHNAVALDFPTYYLGDLISPCLYICLECGFSEIWIDSKEDLEDIKKYSESKGKK